jgi:soluble lytic murein transglycosylase-like protein
VQRVFDPADNVRGGARYLRDLIARYEGRLDLVLAAYNAGEAAVERHSNRIPPFAETRDYVRKVMDHYERLSPRAARESRP